MKMRGLLGRVLGNRRGMLLVSLAALLATLATSFVAGRDAVGSSMLLPWIALFAFEAGPVLGLVVAAVSFVIFLFSPALDGVDVTTTFVIGRFSSFALIAVGVGIAGARLRRSERRSRRLVEGLPLVMYAEDENWLTYISPQIESVLGFTADEWMSGARLWRDRILPDDRQIALDAEQQLLLGDRHMQCEYRIAGRDERVIWIREEAEPLMNDAGSPVYMQGVMYDITEQKQAEARLVTALETEKEASSRLRALHEMQNSFLQAVSHDLRTPLTTILGGALILARDEGAIPPAEAKELLGRMAANAQKLHRLLTNLLDLDRMSRGIVEPNRDMVDMTRLIAGVLDEIEAESHPITITTTAPVFADVDAAHCERIVENLVTNAVRYTPPGTPIWISVVDVGDGALLAVEDAGPGVPEELREAIFEPFRQGGETMKHSPGVGVGLSLVARFAELHRGRVWVEERPGGGASFKVHLPHFAAAASPESESALFPAAASA